MLGTRSRWADNVASYMFNRLERALSYAVEELEHRIEHARRRIQFSLYAGVAFAFGFILIGMAAVTYLIEYVGFSRSVSFTLAAIVIFIIGFVLKEKGGARYEKRWEN